MARVYLALHEGLQRKVAIKVLRPELAESLGVDRFLREIETVANLTHPHILPLHDSGEADGFLFYVMPFVDGESLRERMDREGELAIQEAVRITAQIARALALSPHFILLDEPFAGIDPLAVNDIKSIIGHLKRRGIGVLISDHNVRETLGACDNAYILVDGKVLECGPPDQIAASQAVAQAYLGDEFKL